MTEKKIAQKQRQKLYATITGFLVVATPGVYSAWQGAKLKYSQHVASKKVALEQKIERKKSDAQERDLAKNLEALKLKVVALEATCVSHKDLIELTIKLKTLGEHSSHRRSSRPIRSKASEGLAKRLKTLKVKVAKARKIRVRAAAKMRSAPKMRDPGAVRRLLIQQVKK